MSIKKIKQFKRDKKIIFAKEYIIDFDATRAAKAAGYAEKAATSTGYDLKQDPEVQDMIATLIKERSDRTQITADNVIKMWWGIATADANDVVQYRRNNCRFCYGIDHQYQWTEGGFKKGQEEGNIVSNEGGFGFDCTKEPNPKCPECKGEGVGHLHVKDSTKLTGAARQLYNGAKITKLGLEVSLRDRDAALVNVARHLGMFVDKTESKVSLVQTPTLEVILNKA